MQVDPVTRPGIVVVGSNMVDLISYLERQPQQGETVFGRKFFQGFGGKGANQACMAALLGGQVEIVTCIGDDLFGPGWSAHFEEFGVGTRHMKTVEGIHSGVASIWVEADGANRIVLGAGANTHLEERHVERSLDHLFGERAWDVVLCQLEVSQASIAQAFATGRKKGAVNILNPGPAAPLRDDILLSTDWLLPNETELRLLAGEMYGLVDEDDLRLAQKFAEKSGIGLVVTLGGRGAVLIRRGEACRPLHLPAPAVDVADTTGAGDCFAGAFAYGIAAGWDPVKAVKVAIAVSADSVRRSGTAASYPRGEALGLLVGGAAREPEGVDT